MKKEEKINTKFLYHPTTDLDAFLFFNIFFSHPGKCNDRPEKVSTLFGCSILLFEEFLTNININKMKMMIMIFFDNEIFSPKINCLLTFVYT